MLCLHQQLTSKLTSWTGMFSFINTFIKCMDVSSTNYNISEVVYYFQVLYLLSYTNRGVASIYAGTQLRTT